MESKKNFKKYGFYLAGSIALALHFGHRTSIDLDFYTKKHFDGNKLIREFQKIFKEDLKEPKATKDILWLKIRNTDLSFFRYPYLLIRPLTPYLAIKLASPEDIIAMKIEAIITRGKKKRFCRYLFCYSKIWGKRDIGFF